MLPEAGLRAMRQCRADGDRGVHPGDDVGDRDAGALRTAAWRAVGLSGDAHHPAHALDHEVVARPLAPGAALAEAGERAVDEPRVGIPQRVVAQAVAGEIAVLVVLDQDIEAGRKRTDQRLPLGDRDVHRDRLLAAIRRGEIGGVAGLATVAVLDPRRPESARVVAALRPLHLDDLPRDRPDSARPRGPQARATGPGRGCATAGLPCKQPSGDGEGCSLTRVVHRRSCSRCSASSENPAPAVARVTYFGLSASRSLKRRTLATPTEWLKKANSGASFGESPANTISRLDSARSIPKRSVKSTRLIASLS